VEWVASPGRSSRSRLGSSMHNDYVQVPDNRPLVPRGGGVVLVRLRPTRVEIEGTMIGLARKSVGSVARN
jgi:hypothetical protein